MSEQRRSDNPQLAAMLRLWVRVLSKVSALALTIAAVLASTWIASRLTPLDATAWGWATFARLEWLFPFGVLSRSVAMYRFDRLVPAVALSHRLVWFCLGGALRRLFLGLLAVSGAWILARTLVASENVHWWALLAQLPAIAAVRFVYDHLERYWKTTNAAGPPIADMAEARFLLPSPDEPHPIAWAGLNLSQEQTGSNFGLVGQNGSGKSLLMRILAASQLAPKDGVPSARAVWWDYKRDAYPVLIGMGISPEYIQTVSPLDARTLAAWDLASEFRTAMEAAELAEALCDDDPNERDPIWTRSAREVLQVVIESFQVADPEEWTLLDLVEVCADPKLIAAAARANPRHAALIEQAFAYDRMTASIMRTLSTKVGRFRYVARMMAKLPRRWSIRKWYESKRPSVLLLSDDPLHSASLRPLYNAMLARMCKVLLARNEEYPSDATYVYLDEASKLKVAGLSDLLTGARSKSVHTCVTVQSREALEEAMGKAATATILAEFPNLALLPPVASPDTRQLLLQLLGSVLARSVTVTDPGDVTRPNSTSHALAQRAAILDSELNAMGRPTPGSGIPLIATTGGETFWRGRASKRWVDAHLPKPSTRAQHVGFIPRDTSLWCEEKALTLNDCRRLGFERPDPRSSIRQILGLAPPVDDEPRDTEPFEPL